MTTVIVTDSCCDLPYNFLVENKIEMIPLTITINGQSSKDELAATGGYDSFYKQMLEGVTPMTSQANVYDFKQVFIKHAKEGNAVIYIGFSGALSGCVASARLAQREVEQEIATAQIKIVDSLCASMGQGLLVYYALKKVQEGSSIDEVVDFIELIKLKINHWFTVSDLKYLFKGGRVSKTAATVGTLLQIKPILHVDNEGRLVPVEKVKGRKKAVSQLIERIKTCIVEPENQVVFISHGDALKEAEIIREELLSKCHVKEVWIQYIGAAVGSHAGPGTLAVFFIGAGR